MSGSGDELVHHAQLVAQNAQAAMDFPDYKADLRTRYACERAVLNVSEGIRNFERQAIADGRADLLMRLSEGVDWQKAKGIGNVIRHDYDTIRDEVIWTVIAEAFPAVANLFNAIAKEAGN